MKKKYGVGQGIVEYGLIVLLIAVVIIGTVTILRRAPPPSRVTCAEGYIPIRDMYYEPSCVEGYKLP
jgi:hypothetical protein